MNITDVSENEVWLEAVGEFHTENPLEILWKRQTQLLTKYHDLQGETVGWTITPGCNLHDARVQFELKHLAWCVVEELTEAMDAFMNDGGFSKFVEELVDALHFLVELMVYCGISWEDLYLTGAVVSVDFEDEDIRELFAKSMYVIRPLGMAMWQFRNKPWKSNQIVTDVEPLQRNLQVALKMLLFIIQSYIKSDLRGVVVLYLRKAEVNKFRIKTRY